MTADDTNECPAPGCERRVPRSMLACREHWYSIPSNLRTALWRAYRSDDLTAHAEAMEECVAYLEANV